MPRQLNKPQVHLDVAQIAVGNSIPCGKRVNYDDASRALLKRICFWHGKVFPNAEDKSRHCSDKHGVGKNSVRCATCYEYISRSEVNRHPIMVRAPVDLAILGVQPNPAPAPDELPPEEEEPSLDDAIDPPDEF